MYYSAMRGWKTWVAFACALATGLSMIVNGVIADPINTDLVYQGVINILTYL